MAKRSKPKSRKNRRYSAGFQLSLLAAIGMLSSFLFSNAVLSAHTYHRHGMLHSMDAKTQTLTIVKKHASGRQVFVWNEGTEFLKGVAIASPDSILPGAEVVVYYNRGLFSSLTAVHVAVETRN